MTRNPITNEIELNLADSHLIRRIDEQCDLANPVEVDVNDDTCLIASLGEDFTAQLKQDGQRFSGYGHTAGCAFLNLMKQIVK